MVENKELVKQLSRFDDHEDARSKRLISELNLIRVTLGALVDRLDDKYEAALDKALDNNARIGRWYEDELSTSLETNAKLLALCSDMIAYYSHPNDIDYKREADLLERAHTLGVS